MINFPETSRVRVQSYIQSSHRMIRFEARNNICIGDITKTIHLLEKKIESAMNDWLVLAPSISSGFWVEKSPNISN